MKKLLTAATALILLQATSCQLNENLQGVLNNGGQGGSTGNSAALLAGVYNSMRGPFEGNVNVFALSEVTTDERIMPTRGPDWDDNGVWRQLHLHQWDANHSQIENAFNGLNGIVFAATDMLRFNPSIQQAAEARFLRAFAMYWELDMFDQVPYREPGEPATQEARVRKGTEALNYIISEVTAVQNDLPAAPVTKANKDAARVLLMKCYLNKGVYASRANPSFAAADMNSVIKLADEIISSNKYTFPANYFDNFAPNNGAIGSENIFTEENIGGTTGSDMAHHWFFVSHYNMKPSGYNGPCTSSDFYDKFEATDKRRGVAYVSPGNLPLNPGKRVNVGFLAGQQYDLTTDAPLKDRSGAPLAFTKAVSIVETGRNLEVTGIRTIKYPADVVNADYKADNDLVHFRLADVLLMKAEAILRGGTGTSAGTYGSTPLTIVNSIRTHASRGASALASITPDVLLDERGRELWNEMWRRQDMVRFGKFLGPIQERAQTSASTYLIFPIPNQQIAVNALLTQNPGY